MEITVTEDEIWKIILTVVAVTLVGSCVGAMHSCEEDRKKCVEKYQGKPHSVEVQIGQTADGCKISKVTPFDEKCYEYRDLYVTNCEGGVSWDEHVSHGKTTEIRTESTSTHRRDK